MSEVQFHLKPTMKRFHCDRCETLVVLENDHCTCCKSRLAFVPDLLEVVAWSRPDGTDETERTLGPGNITYRLCRNYTEHNTCNWVVATDEPTGLCVSCRLTKVIPDLSVPENLERWYKLEAAKRRLVVGLIGLSLPTTEDDAEPRLAFQFLADHVKEDQTTVAVLTGHDDGLITINIAEADDPERERRRVEMHEPYRTLVGHFRHEVGHFYWDRLIKNSRRLDAFRALFGDETQDYGEALKRHYSEGPPPNWQQEFVSTYASSHPWEDWAETWAHYLHMVDSLETAYESGLSLNPRRRKDPQFVAMRPFSVRKVGTFSRMIDRWMALTYILNDLNRGLGLHDAYPFVLSERVIEKLKFVHQTIATQSRSRGESQRTIAAAQATGITQPEPVPSGVSQGPALQTAMQDA
ncbi:MAG: zinc-binding metallopeptidase family protein [Panacagrimonas sp.]